jgi:hypothetical protein
LIPKAYTDSQTLDQRTLITEISISGLKRTKQSVAEMALKKFLGQEGEHLNVDEVYAAIKDTGILEPLSVEIEDCSNGEGKRLKVEVREKWAIFPLPIVFLSSGDMSFGGFFIDTNAFGLNDKFFLGGMYSSTGWLVGGGYMHTAGDTWFPGWRVSAFFSRNEHHDTDQQNRDLRIFKLDSIRGSVGINYPFMDIFNWSLNGYYREIILQDFDKPLQAPESGARMFGIGTEMSVRKTYWDGFLLSEQSASVRYTFYGGIDSPSFHVITLRGVYKKSLIPGFRINLHTGIVYEPDVPVLFESAPSSVQIKILPNSFAAQHYAGASLGIEKYLFKFPFGTLSALASYQVVYSHGSILGDAFDHGVVGAVSFYLSQLAIPAVEVGIAYNVAADYPQVSFSIGMSF